MTTSERHVNLRRRSGKFPGTRLGAARLGEMLVAAVLLGGALPAAAQSFDLGGFIKTSYYYDTQQIVGAREGDFVLYPAFATDVDGEPNDIDNLLFFPLFSRLSLGVGDLPETLGAEVEGYIETDFYGPSNDEINTLRIRRAFVTLDWGDREALFGMEWSPFFLTSWARTVATEAGAPFNPFARYPMVRLRQRAGDLTVTGTLAQQRDAFQEIGGLQQEQEAALPMAILTAEYGAGGSSIGLNALTKWIRPDPTGDRFQSGAVQAFANLATEAVRVRTDVTYGGDLADHLMTGGYAIAGGEARPLNVVAAWADVETVGPVSVGLFGGYLENLGTDDDGLDPDLAEFAARGYAPTEAVRSVWRVSPRLTVTSGSVRFGLEAQATGARYVTGVTAADVYDDTLAPAGEATDDVVNLRGNLSVFLTF
ncbi:MAG: hypothetical protein AAF845_03845 [Bacteroidota bacterium]